MMFLITDENYLDVLNLDDERCSMLPRPEDFSRSVYGAAAVKASPIPRIRMEEWPDRIADQRRRRASAKEVWRQSRIGVWNQAETSYCHAFSTVMNVAVARERAGLPFKELSPSSVGGPVTGYTNQGWYIEGDLAQAVKVGVATTEFVPRKTTRRGDFKPGWQADAAETRVLEFFDGQSRDVELLGSYLLAGYGYTAGLNWWGHAIWFMDLLDLNTKLPATDWRRYGFELLNSWGEEWGDKGTAVLNGNKAIADTFFPILSVT